DTGGRGDVERAVQPDAALGKGHLVGEDAGAVVNAVAVRVCEEQDAVRQLLFQTSLVEVRPRRVADEKLTAPAERGHDRMGDQRRRGRDLGSESLRQINRLRGCGNTRETENGAKRKSQVARG